jgi:two-component system, NtrC family, sensor histidine kinase HydH
MPSANDNPFLSALAEEFDHIRAEGHVRQFRAGNVIFAAGDEGNGFYVVESGQVRISAVLPSGEQRELAVIGAGDFFGEMAMVDDAPRSATATAESDTTTVFLARDTLLQLLARRPSLALYIIREFSLRMRLLNQKYLNDVLNTERLAMVGRFASTIVHDFTNPLTVIGLASEMGTSAHASPELREKARKRIGQQVDRMTNMLHELIDFTKPSGNRPGLKRMDFAVFFQPLADELRQELAERKVELLVAAPLPSVALMIEPRRLARLFYNLCNNAADEMRQGGKIFLRFRPTAAALRIDVEDTGKGIAPEIAATLFQPFATHGKAHGTGLGLTICKKIVEDHGGQITAQSEPGKGATFSVTLPLAR